MNRVIIANDGRTYRKPSTTDTAKAIAAGAGIVTVGILLPYPIYNAIPEDIQRLTKTTDSVMLKQKAQEALELGKVKNKGLKIFSFDPKNELGKNWTFSDAFELVKRTKNKISMRDIWNHHAIIDCKNGKNAAFWDEKNAIYMNFKKMGVSVFHEIGHAMNFHNSKFWNAMQHLRLPGTIASIAFPAIAILKRKKAENEEPKNIFDKITTFIKNNVGKLSFIALLPMVTEEIKASSNGKNLAKQLVDAETLKKVKSCNRFGAASYILHALTLGVFAFGANKLRDYIAKPQKDASQNFIVGYEIGQAKKRITKRKQNVSQGFIAGYEIGQFITDQKQKVLQNKVIMQTPEENIKDFLN